ncbi:relaxin receptor 1 isoform X10 [Bos mutus]|uniref:relaxin receptor 1 isoform X10 n=1 Tax=Bos mutus TaxID=72004 RepID=UPI0038B58C94
MTSHPVFLYILIFGKYFAPGRAQNAPCDLGYFPCGNTTKCLPQQLQCNGVDDCENHVDEDNCGDINGWSTQFDRYYGNNYKMTSLYPSIVAETSECLVGSAPMQCICQGLELECDEINLRAVPSVSSNVTFMSLRRNLIRKLPPNVFKRYHGLQTLCLQNNKIRSVSVYAFRGLYSLTKLYLSHNRITLLKPGVFEDLHRLEWLVLMNNILTRLPDKSLCQHMPRLHWLNLSYNPIQTIQANQFDNLIKLKSLSLEGIEISNIQQRMFRPLMNLSYIYFKRFQYCGYAPHVRICKPNTDGLSSLEDLLASIIQRVFVWVVSAVTCFGNIFVICMRPYIRSENKLHAMSIISLCCADCLMGIYLFVIGAFDLKFRGEYNKHAQLWMESIHCQLLGSLAILSTEVSVLLLTFLTLEKYICIVYPFRCLRPGKCRTITVLILIWIIGVIVAFIPLSNKEFFKNYYGTNGVCFPLHSEDAESTGAQIYSVAIFLGINLAAFIIIVFSYGSMFYSIHQSAITANEIRNQVKKEMILAKRFFFIVFTDALCWIPIFILKFLSLLQVEIPGTITSWVVIFILPINSALNPILYTLTTRPFKEMIHQFWYNYRQRRSIDSKRSQKTYAPSFIWVEMWPMQEMPTELMEPVLFADSSELSLISQSTKLNSYS